MTRLQFDVALAIVTNLPSLVLAAIFARSWWSAALIGAAPKALFIAGVIAMGGGAGIPIDQQLISITSMLIFSATMGLIGLALQRAWLHRAASGQVLLTVLTLLMWALLASGYVFGMWSDARRGNGGYFVADLLIPPFGIIRGVLMLLGFI